MVAFLLGFLKLHIRFVFRHSLCLDNQTWQTVWKTAPLTKEQLCEYENQTLEAFVAVLKPFVCQV